MWLGLSIAGVVSFGFLAWVALALGTMLGAAYTGDVELVGFISLFSAACAAYTILAFEIFWHRERLKRVRPVVRATVAWVIAAPWGAGLGFLLLVSCSHL